MEAFRRRDFGSGLQTAAWFRRLALLAISFVVLAVVTFPAAAAEKLLSVSYEITVAGVYVGRADAVGHFADGGYAIALTGNTGGISRLVLDANATLSADGNIRGTEVLPAHYQVDMTEDGEPSRGRMTMRDRRVMDLFVDPGLAPSLEHVPLTMDHVRDITDPVSTLFIPVAGAVTGETACNRTLSIFDGWQRFDVDMSFLATRTVFGSRDGYSGQSYVCSARYTPIAGHDLTTTAVAYMSENDRLEVSLIPVDGLGILIPYQLLIGTELGDLVIRLDSIRVTDVPAAVAGR